MIYKAYYGWLSITWTRTGEIEIRSSYKEFELWRVITKETELIRFMRFQIIEVQESTILLNYNLATRASTEPEIKSKYVYS